MFWIIGIVIVVIFLILAGAGLVMQKKEEEKIEAEKWPNDAKVYKGIDSRIIIVGKNLHFRNAVTGNEDCTFHDILEVNVNNSKYVNGQSKIIVKTKTHKHTLTFSADMIDLFNELYNILKSYEPKKQKKPEPIKPTRPSPHPSETKLGDAIAKPRQRKNGDTKIFSPDNINPAPQQSQTSQLTYYGYSLHDVDFGKFFPWANDVIYYEPDITIANVIMLWWLDKYHHTSRVIPGYFERNYVKNFNIEVRKLQQTKIINFDNSLTELGSTILKNNFRFVELHRNGWLTNKLNPTKYEPITPFLRAERLSKDGFPDKSNDILLKLKKGRNNDAGVYERLAINYRKLKNYKLEVNIINEFLEKILPQYEEPSYTSWNTKFNKRLARAEELLVKQITKAELDDEMYYDKLTTKHQELRDYESENRVIEIIQ